ncbi:rod shape-determining protein MreC [Fusobacterium vincentii]|uniref:Cell shape-determining protein MreC n=2 Tax=Fusobacterium TaxID=848 RepID=C7XQN8_FUSVC|nr:MULTISPECIES: rod shape-determining protein MreC [Fusobacterium]ALF19132.1 cell shape-determining protein MreC [Fusobacterium vincentii ChDC F8]ATV06246.1 rod shape-determining protein MreC [Fusobacterium vincentii]EEU33111.1 rod shape-determining protein MreC [Fusobacterium vincentii 3_1_36A2]EMP15767.1 spore coat protein regulator protein YlbO [Fusobacterium nucleatum CC53]EMP16072.1 spore coat protein regulator protein YlbO [Fusobacterium nucleatum CC53]
MKKESKIKILLPILAVIVVTVLIFNRLLFKLKDQIDKVALPIQSKVYNVANRAISIKDIIFSYEEIIAENENLKKENMELKIQKERNQKILEENERLLKLLEMKENSIYKGNLKFARVSFSDINNLNNKIFIDLGAEDGIKIDMITVYGDYLVGKIVAVHNNYSEVELITNPNSIISAKTMRDILGIARGSDEEDGLLYFQPSIVEDNLKEGDEIITSGISDIYPEGIKIGKIEEIDEKENYGYKRVTLKPGFESKDLRELIVIGRENTVNRPIVKEEVEELEGDEKQ